MIGFLFYGIHKFVGSRVDLLLNKHKSDTGEVLESLMVIGNIESPGIVILRENELEMISITGRSCVLPFNEMEVIKEGSALPGKYLWGKRAFILKSPERKRLGFGVPESVGVRWSGIFQAKGVPGKYKS